MGRGIFVAVLVALAAAGGTCAQTWRRLGPEGGMVVSLASAGDTVYLGTTDGHVFGSRDGAKSWELRGRVGARLDAVVTSIVAEPRGGRVFAGVWYQAPGAGGGVFESSDQGRTWTLLGLQAEAVRALELAPSQPDELVAGTRTGVFLSSDRGKMWGRISPEGDEEIKNLDSLAIDPRDPQVIYAGTYHLPWLTRDGGKSWKPVSAGIIDDSDIMSLRLDVTNPDRAYMSACSGIYRSENQGREWIKLQGIPYAARRTQVMVQDPANPKTFYAGTTEGLWVTRDGGESWTRATSKDWVVNSIVVLGGGGGMPGRVVLGTEGRGIEVSDDGGVTFTEANHGFSHVIVNRLVADENDSSHLLMLVERSTRELLESGDAGESWSNLSLNALENGKPTTLKANLVEEIYGSPWGWVLRFDDGRIWLWEREKQLWKEWNLRLEVVPQKRPSKARRTGRSAAESKVVAEAVLQVLEKYAVVATNRGLLRCELSGYCERLKAFGRNEKVQALWVSTTGDEIVDVTEEKLAWSKDAGETAVWRDLPVAAKRVYWVDVADSDSDSAKTIYLGTDEGVFSSGAGGSISQRVTAGLPAGPVEQWLRKRGFGAASERDGGFYVSQDNGGSWRRVDQDAERGRFIGLVAGKDGAILVGSQSEGLLRLEMDPKAK